MKVLVIYDYPPSPGGLATQGDLLFRGLREIGVDAHAAHFESAQEKEWYYRWFTPDIVVGVGYWGHTPHLVLHPQRYGIQPVPWLVADGYIANYQEVLNALPLILVTSNWVKKTYIRDGLDGSKIEVLPVGCDTAAFAPRDRSDPKVVAIREALGVAPDQVMILTVGGDAASKGAQEVMQALAIIDAKAPDWKYVCKVWPQPRTQQQNLADLQLATHLGIDKNVVYTTNVVSRAFMPYLMAACDIYAAPSRLEGFGMPQVEAGSCGKPVLGIKAMGMLDTLVHGQTAFLAGVALEIRLKEATLGEESGFTDGHRVVFRRPRAADYRASVHDIANYLLELMANEPLRRKTLYANCVGETGTFMSGRRRCLSEVEEAKQAAIEVLVHNARGTYHGLPRTAGWGYPEPYTRDLMIAALGILVSGNERLIRSLRRVLETLARNQTERGHIPSLVHDREDRGASDTTPLFLLATGCFRIATGEGGFLEEAVRKAMVWMDYQSPEDRTIVGQLPTTDWRDEQWVPGFGLFVNSVVHSYLRLYGEYEKAETLRELMTHFTITGDTKHRHVHEGLVLRRKPYYALWAYKLYRSERFDLLGNSLAILSGIATRSRAKALASWIEKECEVLRERGELGLDLPPNLFPYIRPDDPDWIPRYQKYNLPGEYHNGGVWPFICGFYVAALVAAGRQQLAKKRLEALTRLARPAREAKVSFGFNEWFRAQDGTPQGQDWQTWSAAMYLYAAVSVEEERTPFFDEGRSSAQANDSEVEEKE
jgi:starch synthase